MSRAIGLLGVLGVVAVLGWAQSITLGQGRERPPRPDDPTQPAPAAGAKDFKTILIVCGDSTSVDLRYNTKSGETFFMYTNSQKKVEEGDPVPAGDYMLQAAPSDSQWWAFRIEKKTGRSWALYNNRWNSVADINPVSPGDYQVIVRTNKNQSWIRRFDAGSGRLWYAQWKENVKAFEWVEMGR